MIATADSEALESAFNAFSQHSAQLETAYRELQDKVERLVDELADAKSARHAELLEKERLGNRLEHLFETLPGGLVVIDGGGTVTEHNERAVAMLGQPLVGCSWAKIARREFCPGADTVGDLKLRDGRWVNLSRRPLDSEAGDILLVTDVTEVRRMSQLLQRQQRLSGIGEMTAILAHEIRTPLASALLYLSRLEDGDAEHQRVVSRIGDRLHTLKRMVNDMLGYAGGARRCGQMVRIDDLFDDVMAAVRPQLQERCRISVSLAETDLQVEANAHALKGALLNLVNNSLQACAQDADIELAGMRSAGQVILAVVDNGPGISPEVQGRVFEPFFTTRPQGTGLGLAVVQSVVTAHDGEALIDSGPSGTTIALCLPASDSPRECADG